MNDTKSDAEEFGQHVKSGGWRLGLLVARNVERSTAGRGSRNPVNRPDSQKVSASQFAEMAGLHDHKIVLRYLDAWQREASLGRVPFADTLSPGAVVPLDMDKLGKFRVTELPPSVSSQSTKGSDWEPSSKQAEREEDTTEPDNAHTWVATADRALRSLVGFPESTRWLSQQEREIVAGWPGTVSAILTDLRRRPGSQRAS